MSEYVLSIDPGWSSGVVLIGYDNSSVWREQAYQFEGGRAALAGFLDYHWIEAGWDGYNDEPRYQRFDTNRGLAAFTEDRPNYSPINENDGDYPADLTVIVEKFQARATEGFSYTTRSLEPLVCEGTIIDRGLVPDYSASEKRWRQPKDQYLVGGEDLADKKKRQHRFLKESGFEIGRKEIGETLPNYDDARSATAHALAYLVKVRKHQPTWKLITDWSEANGN